MEIRRDRGELLSWSKQDGDPFESTGQADEGCSAYDFSSVYGKGEACRRAPGGKAAQILNCSGMQFTHSFTHAFTRRFDLYSEHLSARIIPSRNTVLVFLK